MSCNCLEHTILEIKSQYNKLQHEALKFYMRGDFDLAIESYDKAFFQARMFFGLSQVPPESVNYLIDACDNCMEYCCSSRAQSCYLRMTMEEVRACVNDERQEVTSRAAALTACIQLGSCLVKQLNKEKFFDDANKVLAEIDNIWQRYSSDLVVIH